MKSGRFIGVMSGTSLDGVDVVLATIDEHRVAQLASLSWPIPVSLKQAVLDICQGQQLTLSQFGQLDTQLGRLFADAVNALLKEQNLQARDAGAIGCGQTVWHEPTGVAPHTLQIGDNNQIVARTGITVVGDFRRRDIALGGQGAPLVPAFHHALLAHPTERRMVLNIGGIANLSLLIPGQPVGGYDTGPGNMLMDAWIGVRPVNLTIKMPSGHGRVKLFSHCCKICSATHISRNPHRKAPDAQRLFSTTARGMRPFAAIFRVDPRDVQATLAELTAVTISEQVLLSGGCERLMVCGGGRA